MSLFNFFQEHTELLSAIALAIQVCSHLKLYAHYLHLLFVGNFHDFEKKIDLIEPIQDFFYPLLTLKVRNLHLYFIMAKLFTVSWRFVTLIMFIKKFLRLIILTMMKVTLIKILQPSLIKSILTSTSSATISTSWELFSLIIDPFEP